MWTRSCFLGRALLALLVCSSALGAKAQEGGDIDVQAVFFEALDLKEGGQCQFAVGRFQLCLELDPTLHQARLHMAECYQEMGEQALAIREARFYLKADFPEAEVDRAKAVISGCGGDPDLIPVGDEKQDPPDGDGTEPEGDPVEPTVEVGPRVPSSFPGHAPKRWSHLRLGTGVLVTHFINEAKLTAVGPLIDLRFMPERYVEFGLQARVAMGPYPERGGLVTVPEFGVSAAVSIPLGAPHLTAGVVVPLVLSRYADKTRADGGILGEVGIHVPVKATPLVIEGLFEAGYLVSPVIGGRVGVAFQLGPLDME